MAAIYTDLENKVVVVTGGGSGIGEAIVKRFADQRCKVGFIDIARDLRRRWPRSCRPRASQFTTSMRT